MFDNYKYIESKVPYILKATPFNQAIIKSCANAFDLVDTYINMLEGYWLIDKAKGEFLDDLGASVEVPRNNEIDADYRKRIKLAYQTLDIVPTLDNILELVRSFTGLFPEIREGWQIDGEPARYDVDFIALPDFDFSLIDKLNLEKVAGGGVKINSRKCLENWEESYYVGDIYAGDTFFSKFFRRSPKCDFTFENTGYVGDVHTGENEIILTGDKINFGFRRG